MALDVGSDGASGNAPSGMWRREENKYCCVSKCGQAPDVKLGLKDPGQAENFTQIFGFLCFILSLFLCTCKPLCAVHAGRKSLACQRASEGDKLNLLWWETLNISSCFPRGTQPCLLLTAASRRITRDVLTALPVSKGRTDLLLTCPAGRLGWRLLPSPSAWDILIWLRLAQTGTQRGEV